MKRMLSHSCVSLLALLTGFLAVASVAEAQLVQVGPGYVKAPFVRVYRTPYGTSVRAPFTRVDGGTPTFGRHHYQPPYAETHANVQSRSGNYVEDVAELSLLERQRRLVAKSAWRLERDLAGFRSGSHWQSVLQLPSEFRHGNLPAESGEQVQPDPAAVQSALDNFDQVASERQSRKIAQLNSFRSTHRLLREYVSLLSLPSGEPEPVEPEAMDQPPVEIPAPGEQPAEELPLPLLKFPQ